MLASKKVLIAQRILQKKLGLLIVSITLDKEDPSLAVKLKDGARIYIQWNDHDQYSYSILFSEITLDRIRLDNYDNKWQVPSRPHHFHPRFSKEGFSSPMHGEPKLDLIFFCDLILSGKFLSKEYRFSLKDG